MFHIVPKVRKYFRDMVSIDILIVFHMDSLRTATRTTVRLAKLCLTQKNSHNYLLKGIWPSGSAQKNLFNQHMVTMFKILYGSCITRI